MVRAVRRLWEEGRVVFMDHFRRRSDERQIPHSWLPEVFETAEIVSGPRWNGEHENWSVTLRGRNADGEEVTIGLGVDLGDEVLYLVTLF
jgi:hypothetical protein